MSHRFSMVNKALASKYLILRDFSDAPLVEVVFSMLEHYECLIPDWLYEMLEGLYLAKYRTYSGNTTRASVLVLKTREDAVFVAKLLLSLGEGHYEFQWVNGNYVVYTTQEKGYWWIHDNMIIRVANHIARDKDVRATEKPMQSPAEQEKFQLCETLDTLDELLLNKCIRDAFWDEVPKNIFYAYLDKLPSDGDEVDWNTPLELNGQQVNMSQIEWPTQNDTEEHQWGCDPEKSKVINNAFDTLEGRFNATIEDVNAQSASHQYDVVKITDAHTDKRWYYLGEVVHFFASTASADENVDLGQVIADVHNDIFPTKDTTPIYMRKVSCGPRSLGDRRNREGKYEVDGYNESWEPDRYAQARNEALANTSSADEGEPNMGGAPAPTGSETEGSSVVTKVFGWFKSVFGF